MAGHKIEIIFNDDNTTFVNFWDYVHGYDVTAMLENGILKRSSYYPENPEDDQILYDRPISFEDFLKEMKESIDKREE